MDKNLNLLETVALYLANVRNLWPDVYSVGLKLYNVWMYYKRDIILK